MKLHVVNEETEAFDIIIGSKKAKHDTVRLSIFEYATGIRKCEIPKR